MLLNGVDADLLLLFTAPLESYNAVGQRKQRVIASKTHVFARQKHRPTLSDDDVARYNILATGTFDAQTLRLAVPTVTRTSTCFLMSHSYLPPQIPE